MQMTVRPALVRFDNLNQGDYALMMTTMTKKITTAVKKAATKSVSLTARPSAVTGKRYSLVNKATGSVRRGANTRAEARSFKKENERIWDTAKAAYIR